MLEGFNSNTGEGRTTVTSTCSEHDAGVLNRKEGRQSMMLQPKGRGLAI